MRIFSIFFAVFGLVCSASAQPVTQQIKADGSEFTTILGSAEASAGKLHYYFVSPGNISKILSVQFEAPAGAVLKLRTKNIGTTSPDAALAAESGWIDLKLTNNAGKDRATYTFSSTAAEQSHPTAAAVVDCSKLTVDEVNRLINFYKVMFNVTMTAADVCGSTVPKANPDPSNPGSDENGATPYFRSLLSKDTCISAKNSRYLVVAEIDLSKLSPAQFDAGLVIKGKVIDQEYRGGMAASIKPISDGKFAPRPLILMDSPGSWYAKDQVTLVKWKRKKIASRKKLRYAKSLYYQGHILSSALVDGVLTGGKGTFEITNGTELYSVCFRLQRTRQRVNGYPN